VNQTATIDPITKEFDLSETVSKNRLRGLWRMMKGFRLPYLGATLSLAVSAGAKTTTYLLLRYFVDSYFVTDTRTVSLWMIALGFILLAGVEGTFSFLSGRLASYTAEGITRRLRNFLFDHIQHLTFAYHSKMQTGELIQRSTSDVDAVRRFYADQAISVGRILLLFVINFSALLSLNVRLAFVSIVAIPVIIVVSAFFFRKVARAYEAYQEQEATLSTTLQENLSGVRVVKAFARQAYEMDKFERDNWEKFVRGRTLLRTEAFFWPTTDLICGFQMLAGYLVGALMAIHGDITVGTYIAYTGLVVWIIFPMRNLGRLIVQTSTGLVSYDRVSQILKQKREPLEEGEVHPEAPVKGRLEFEHVSFEYEPGEKTLDDVSFTCQPGQVIALLGSTGSGKTTLVNLLPRFFEYTSGRILLDGIDLKSYPRKYLRQQIGIVEQEPFLFSRSIRENITYGLDRPVTQAEVEQAARAAAIHEVILSFPLGYDTIVGEKGVTLSGGQKQRVTIARTLLKDPRILIMDDSTSAVDTETEAEIRSALEAVMAHRTTFVIAHRIQSIMSADLILVMDKGRILQRGQHADLVARDGIYQRIFSLQTRIEDELEKEISSAG
jgi:ATP-binding cassette subfamily B protein